MTRPLSGIPRPLPRRYLVHGTPVSIDCSVASIASAVDRVLGEFAAPHPSAEQSLQGSVLPFAEQSVLPSLSARAVRVDPLSQHQPGWLVRKNDPLEMYRDGERCWVVDDRWGIAEMNLLKGTWRSWLLPHPRLEAHQRLEAAVLWPMFQLLRTRGLHVLPAASVVVPGRGGGGVLMLCPFDLGPELSSLVRAGFRIIGQRWTAARDTRNAAISDTMSVASAAVDLLRMPGWVDRPKHALRAVPPPPQKVMDLTLEHCGASLPRAECHAVLVVDAGRRSRPSIRKIEDADEAMQLLRAAWPMTELQPERRSNYLAVRLAQRCTVYSAALSRDGRDIARVMNIVREPQRPRISVMLTPALSPRARAAG